MSSITNSNSSMIEAFVEELQGFAARAEDALTKIESDTEGNKHLFSIFSEQMFTIRGTSQQLELPQIAHIAGLGEEIALKAVSAESRSQIRKCVGSLWDALTTVKYLIVHRDEETSEEQKILVNRMEKTLEALGGARPTVDEDEIEALLRQRG
jgi:chemotaxis protein histidine kinase CheA